MVDSPFSIVGSTSYPGLPRLPTWLLTSCVRLHTPVIGCCCVLLRKVWNRSNFSANNCQHFFCSVIAEAERNDVGSVCTARPTLLGPRTLITHGLQSLMGCIFPTMYCRSQTLLRVVASVCTPLPSRMQQLPTLLAHQCWELLHPFARSLSLKCQPSLHPNPLPLNGLFVGGGARGRLTFQTT